MSTIFYALDEGVFFYACGIPFLLMKIGTKKVKMRTALGTFKIQVTAICIDPDHPEMRGDLFTITDSTPCRVVEIVMSPESIFRPSMN